MFFLGSLPQSLGNNSSLPVAWREPPTDVKSGAKLKQIVGVSYGRLDGYGFHGMEMLQCLAETVGAKRIAVVHADNIYGEQPGIPNMSENRR